MRIVDIQHCAVPIARYDDAAIPSGGRTTSVVAREKIDRLGIAAFGVGIHALRPGSQ